MADTRQSTVVGVFSNRTKAEKAIAALQKAGFQNDQIRLSSENKTYLARDLMDMGVMAEDIGFYQQECQAGHVLISVAGGKRIQDAYSILLEHGAYGPQKKGTMETRAGSSTIDTRASSSTIDTRGSGMAETRTSGTLGTDMRTGKGLSEEQLQEQHMRLAGERLQASKHPEKVGEVILHKEVVSEQQSIDVPVTHEEVVIERRAFSGPVESSQEPLGTGQTIRIPVNAEQVSVTKEKVNIGEVVVGKREVQETQHFSDTVRHEEARIEHEGDVPFWETNADQPPNQAGTR